MTKNCVCVKSDILIYILIYKNSDKYLRNKDLKYVYLFWGHPLYVVCTLKIQISLFNDRKGILFPFLVYFIQEVISQKLLCILRNLSPSSARQLQSQSQNSSQQNQHIHRPTHTDTGLFIVQNVVQ